MSNSSTLKALHIDDYISVIGDDAVARIKHKASTLQAQHIVHVNSTHYGGGVAEMLLSLTLLMNSLGIKTGWRVIRGIPDFFNITKQMHNAMQGGEINLDERTKALYEHVVYENSLRTHLNAHDFVVIHDPQPLPIIKHYKREGKWVWRCHLDLSNPNKKLWNYLKDFVNEYDAAIFTIKKYSQDLNIPQHFFKPAIDPFAPKNQQMSEEAMAETLRRYDIPTDLPIVTQISRFDKWKDPEGVIQAAEIARKKKDFTLILLGNAASDDPEGTEVFKSLLSKEDARTLIMSHGDDTDLVNTLQKKSHVIMQKSTREGFGLTVTEAMWKGTPVIGGNVGGIPTQIDHGENGYLVSNIEEAAAAIVDIIEHPEKRDVMGKAAKEKVRKHFLLSRLLEQYLDLFNSFL